MKTQCNLLHPTTYRQESMEKNFQLESTRETVDVASELSINIFLFLSKIYTLSFFFCHSQNHKILESLADIIKVTENEK